MSTLPERTSDRHADGSECVRHQDSGIVGNFRFYTLLHGSCVHMLDALKRQSVVDEL